MHTGDIACKLIDMLDWLGARTDMRHRLGHGTDFLPLVIGKGRRMQATKALFFVLDGASIIARGIGGIKLIAQHGGDGILGKEPSSETLTARAIACFIEGISNVIG